MTAAAVAQDYCAKMGWYLVAIPAGTKGPTNFGWQKPERAISDPDAARAYFEANPSHNMGLLHGPSGTCAIDIDHVEHTRLIFEGFGIDFDALMASAPRIVGRPDRGKLLFAAPDGLVTHKISWPSKADPRKTEVVFELRAGSVQDVLPPSVHPDTGRPYTWAGADVFGGLPQLPPQILTIWQEWDRFRPQMMDACPWKARREFTPPPKPRRQTESASVIDAFNAAHDMHELLVRFGYKPTGKSRYLSPNSSSGLAGVVLFDDGRAYSHHASDPFDNAHTFDAFDLWCQYEHMGDVGKAVRDAAGFLDVSNDPAHDYDPEAIAHGAKVAAAILPSRRKVIDRGPLADVPEHLLSIPGRLQDAVNFYSTTAPKDQPQFAVQSALAFASVVMGRRWRTDQNNYSALYFVNVAKSATGKEHAKTAVEHMLEAAGLDHMIGPSGYTSASGVFSALVQQPRHISIIDELGKVLASSQAQGNQHKADAQTILMEVFGRQSSTLRPQGFSKMGMTTKQAAEFDKVVRHPSLTLLAMTTPSTLYDNLSSRYVSDGFLGRFLIVESHIGRQVGRGSKLGSPSQQLIEWAKSHATASDGNLAADSHETPPPPVEVPFGPGCGDLLRSCDAAMLALMDEHEKHGLEAMFGRTKEVAQRLALIIARSQGEDVISPLSLQWGIDYATFYALRTVASLSKSMSDSPFEAACKSVYAKIEGSGLKGVTARDLSDSVRAFANLEPRRRKDVLDVLVEDRGIVCRNTNEGQRGRPRFAWFAPEV